MTHKNSGLGLAAATVLAACAAAPEARPPEPQATVIEEIVAGDVETTWDALIAGVGGRDFSIKSASESDRTLRVLVQTAIPSTYVDCGEISVRSDHPEFGARNYHFAAANSVRYLVADERADQLIDVERRTSLNALTNVRLTTHAEGTRISISTHYVMSFKTREFGRNADPRSVDYRLEFPSLGRASLDEQIRIGARTKTVKVRCRPTGDLERRIVSIVG